MGETVIDCAIQMLVEATYTVVNCDRVSLFLLEEEGYLTCHAAPAGGKLGWRLPLGRGVAGSVGATGKTLNIPDAYARPELFDPTQDIKTNYRTKSLICMPLKDRDNAVIGVLQAINKRGGPGGLDDYIPFDSIDEKLLGVLLDLTAHQLRFCKLVADKEMAAARVDTTWALVETVVAPRELHESMHALAKSVQVLLDCQHTLLFLVEHNNIVCRGSTITQLTDKELKFAKTDLVVSDVIGSGEHILLDDIQDAEKLAYIHKRLSPHLAEGLNSAICSPLVDNQSGEVFAVVLALNKRQQLNSATVESTERVAGKKDPIRHRVGSWETSALISLLHRAKTTRSFGFFDKGDLERLMILLRLVAHTVQNSKAYDDQKRTRHKLEALVEMLAASAEHRQRGDLKQNVGLILGYAHEMLECERCTFFTVDNLHNELVGHFTKAGEAEGELHELRVPIKGIAGCVVTTGELLNIQDAWSDRRFSNLTDLQTGYRTRTILCAPLISNGKVIAVMQCINKHRHEYFNKHDEKILGTISTVLSESIRHMAFEHNYKNVARSDNIHSDVKDMLQAWSNTDNQAQGSPRPPSAEMRARRTMSSRISITGDLSEYLAPMRCWTYDHSSAPADETAFTCYISSCLDYFGLVKRFHIDNDVLARCVDMMRIKYKATQYHNWTHAFATFHAVFLLLDSPGLHNVLPVEDMLALFLAALGHDVEHPGRNNNFLINTQAELAFIYNDTNVLENHHASVTCNILQNENPDLMGSIDVHTVRRIRQVVIATILGTDMACHNNTLKKLDEAPHELPGLRASGERLHPDGSLLLSQVLLHAADIIHPALPWGVHKWMSTRIAEEFYTQFQEEDKLGLPSLPFMGKDPHALLGLAPVQVGFIKFVELPMWSGINSYTGEDLFSMVIQNVEKNQQRWQRIADGGGIPDGDEEYRSPPRASDYKPVVPSKTPE